MEKRKPTLKQRRWTTGFSILKTPDDLDQRVESAYNQTDVRIREHSWIEPNRFVLTELGIVQRGKKRVPAVRAYNEKNGYEWYLLQPSASAAPGNIYNASIANKAHGLSSFALVLQNQRQSPISEDPSLAALYKIKSQITLEEALKLQRGNIPVYEGNTQEFTRGRIFKKPNPIQAKITTDGEVEVKGTIIISEEDYIDLSNYLFKQKGQPPSRTIERLLKTSERTEEAKRSITKPLTPSTEYGKEITKEEVSEGPRYLSWLQPKTLPKKFAQGNSAAAIEAFKEQMRFDISVMPHLKGIEDVINDIITFGEFEPKYISAKVASMEQVPTGKKGKYEKAWIAYVKDEKGKLSGFYLIHPPAKDIVEVVYNNGKVKEISPPRAMLFDLKYWPNQDVALKEVVSIDSWLAGAESDVVIEGPVAIPSNRAKPYIYEGAPLLGILGMRRETWRNMVVKSVANNFADRLSGKYGLREVIDDEYIKEAARFAYSNSKVIRSIDRGGPERFADSVLRVVRSYGIGRVEERQLPLTPLK